ncbi:MAG: hypothetical protein VXZ39_11785, partial [Planctomycetota bacterium]|nr:hypothetical protein [Planctomycetota bacterium]
DGDALVDGLCANELQPWLEWTEDAKRVEISSTTITLFDVTDHIHYLAMCHKLCTDTCGQVSLLGTSPLSPDVEVGNCTTVAPAVFFDPANGYMPPDGTEVLVYLAGFANVTDAVSVSVFLSSPVYDEATATLRFDYRLAADPAGGAGRRKLLQNVVSRDEVAVLSRVHVTGNLRVVSRGGAAPSDPTQVSRSTVGVVSRDGATSRSSDAGGVVSQGTGYAISRADAGSGASGAGGAASRSSDAAAGAVSRSEALSASPAVERSTGQGTCPSGKVLRALDAVGTIGRVPPSAHPEYFSEETKGGNHCPRDRSCNLSGRPYGEGVPIAGMRVRSRPFPTDSLIGAGRVVFSVAD